MTQVDSNHRGPLINIVTWITLATMIIFSFSKVATKWTLVRRLQGDDLFMITATVNSKKIERTGDSGSYCTNASIGYGCRLLRCSLNTSAVRLGSAQEPIDWTAI